MGGCAQAHRTCPPKAFISTQPSGVLPEARGTACFRVYGPDCSRAAGSPSEKKGPLPASGDIGAHLLRHPGTSGRAARPLARLQRLGLGNHGLRAGALRQTPSPVCDQPRALSPSGRRRPLPESVAGPAGRAGCSRVCVSSRPRSFERAPSTRRRLLPASGQSRDLGLDPGSPGRPALLGLGPDSRAVIVHELQARRLRFVV